MTPSHHLDDSTLLSYAGGTLDGAFALVAASHLATCAHCRSSLRLAEEIGGHILDAAAPEALSDEALGQVMRKLPDVDPWQAPTAAHAAGDVPLPLRRHIGAHLNAVPWKTVAPGIRRHRIDLPGSNASSLYMLYIAGGKAVPEHGHGGAEITLILSGAYRDALGRFGPGDVADLDEHVEHQPRAEPGAPCICLAATEMPTRFKGFFSRLLQPLVGI